MSKRTEVSPGFGPKEQRSGHGEFPGWRGLQRTGDTVLRVGRLFRAWNAQISDGEVISRGGQTPFADLGTDDNRPQCITSIFCTNEEWGDLGQEAEIRFTSLGDFSAQSDTEPTIGATPRAYRGDTGAYDADALTSVVERRQFWVRDGVENTSSGIQTPATVNSTARVVDRVYFAYLDGSVKYMSPGSTSLTTIGTPAAPFAAGHLMAITYHGRLIVISDGDAEEWNGTTWTVLTMPAATTDFIAVGWTLWDVDDCVYVFGRVADEAKVLKISGSTITVAHTADNTPPSWNWNRPIDITSGNGNLVITFTQSVSITESLVFYTSPDGTTWTAGTLIPNVVGAAGGFGPTRMVSAGGMLWSVGYGSESDADTMPLLYSYDGTEWLEVIAEVGFSSVSGPDVQGIVDIVQIEPNSNRVTDATAL